MDEAKAKMATRKPMTEEEKAKRAEALKKAREAKKAKAEETFSDVQNREAAALPDEVTELKKEIATLKEMLYKQTAAPQVVQIATDVEKVRFLWQAEVADDNVVLFGDGGMYGRIVGKTGTFYVPKPDLSRIMDSMNRLFLDKRWLIVLSGLTDEERESYGVDYKDGELLDRKVFERLVEIGEEIVDIYPDLCDGHKEMVAKRYYEAWQKDSHSVKRDVVVALNKIEPNQAFQKILDEMHERGVND